ncbi:MAG: GNAT family N-acetyltransferase [Anaerolineaceae bacterium]|nr:GNAT family N-acetyltransferase [Anaerolineaceae bacterium]
MKLRIATLYDVEALARVHVAAWQAAYRGLVPDLYLEDFTIEKRSAAFQKELESHAAKTYLLEEGSLTVAILTIGPNRDADLDPCRDGEIWGIYISPPWWRRGIGRQLVLDAEQMLAINGYERVVLWVLEGNVAARCFYKAVGYRADGAEKFINLGIPLLALRYARQLCQVSADQQ